MKRAILSILVSFTFSGLVIFIAYKLFNDTKSVSNYSSHQMESMWPDCPKLPVKFTRPEHLEHGMAIAQLGEFKELDEAERNEAALRGYITECTKFNDTWFCHPDLLNRISIKKGYYSYFLVIEELTEPIFMHLCAFMWANTEFEEWARERNHNCTEFKFENTTY